MKLHSFISFTFYVLISGAHLMQAKLDEVTRLCPDPLTLFMLKEVDNAYAQQIKTSGSLLKELKYCLLGKDFLPFAISRAKALKAAMSANKNIQISASGYDNHVDYKKIEINKKDNGSVVLTLDINTFGSKTEQLSEIKELKTRISFDFPPTDDRNFEAKVSQKKERKNSLGDETYTLKDTYARCIEHRFNPSSFEAQQEKRGEYHCTLSFKNVDAFILGIQQAQYAKRVS